MFFRFNSGQASNRTASDATCSWECFGQLWSAAWGLEQDYEAKGPGLGRASSHLPMHCLQQTLTAIHGKWKGDQQTPVLDDDVDAPGQL